MVTLVTLVAFPSRDILGALVEPYENNQSELRNLGSLPPGGGRSFVRRILRALDCDGTSASHSGPDHGDALRVCYGI